MFLASKSVGTGIVFALLTTGMLALILTSLGSGSDLKQEAPALLRTSDVKRMQQALQDQGHYRGKIDGLIGLHTRASICEFQKAENLPVTGRIDPQTAGKLGVAWRASVEKREQIGPQKDKPWAGTKSAKATSRRGNRLPKVVPSAERQPQ